MAVRVTSTVSLTAVKAACMVCVKFGVAVKVAVGVAAAPGPVTPCFLQPAKTQHIIIAAMNIILIIFI
jgi:hypothetical protein